jgi:hypothetical protein
MTLEMDVSFLADTTGQSVVALRKIVLAEINYSDDEQG